MGGMAGMEEEEHCSTVKVVKEGKEGRGASSMWVEKGHIHNTEEARVEGGGGDDGVA
jgi:hypothetical protein